MNQLIYIYIYPLFFRFFSHMSHYRILSIEFPVLYRRSLVVICLYIVVYMHQSWFFFFNLKIFNSYMRSQTWTPLPPPTPQHLSGSSPSTSPKHAAPYVRHGLAIQFLHDSIHVRIPILPNHPTLSLSLWVQKSVIHTWFSWCSDETRLGVDAGMS